MIAQRTIITSAFLISALIGMPAQAADTEDGADDKVFYYLGTVMGRNLKPLGLSDGEGDTVVKAWRETLAGEEENLNDALYNQKLNEISQQRMAATAQQEAVASRAYLNKMATEKGGWSTYPHASRSAQER